MPNLPAVISSPSDVTALVLEIRSYAKWYNHYVIAQKAGAKHADEQPELSPAATETIRASSKDTPLTSESLDQLIASLERIGTHSPVLTITLAAPAPREVREQLVTWCREQLSPDVLITFRFDSTILGGMVVRAGSHIYDWSFRRQLMDKRASFAEVLERV